MTEAIVLAGGLGTRLRGVVQDVPKPMARVRGRPFLEYLLDYWTKQGVRSFILAAGYRHEIIRAHFGDSYGRAKIKYSIEKKPLGTGGGLLRALPYLKTGRNFLLLNGDTFFEVPRRPFEKFHRLRRADMSFALAACGPEDRYERIQTALNGRIESLQPRGSGERSGRINGGVYLLNRRLFEGFPEKAERRISFEDEMIPAFLKNGKKLFGFGANGRFLDIGTPASYKAAGKFLARQGRNE